MAVVAGRRRCSSARCTGRRRRATRGAALEEALAGFRVLAREPSARVLVGLLAGSSSRSARWTCSTSCSRSRCSTSAARAPGYLNAAFGAGGVAGIAVTVALVGRAACCRRSCSAFSSGARPSCCSRAWPTIGGALLLLAVAGAGRSLLDVAGRTILQRTAPTDVLSRVFGVLEGLSMAGLALGSLLTPALVAPRRRALGDRRDRRAAAAGGAALGAARSPRSTAELRCRSSRSRCCARCRCSRRSARRRWKGSRTGSSESSVPAGTAVVREGEPGDRFYVVADGELEVDAGGPRAAAAVGRGDGFGEIALLGTCRARRPSRPAPTPPLRARQGRLSSPASASHPRARARPTGSSTSACPRRRRQSHRDRSARALAPVRREARLRGPAHLRRRAVHPGSRRARGLRRGDRRRADRRPRLRPARARASGRARSAPPAARPGRTSSRRSTPSRS